MWAAPLRLAESWLDQMAGALHLSKSSRYSGTTQTQQGDRSNRSSTTHANAAKSSRGRDSYRPSSNSAANPRTSQRQATGSTRRTASAAEFKLPLFRRSWNFGRGRSTGASSPKNKKVETPSKPSARVTRTTRSATVPVPVTATLTRPPPPPPEEQLGGPFTAFFLSPLPTPPPSIGEESETTSMESGLMTPGDLEPLGLDLVSFGPPLPPKFRAYSSGIAPRPTAAGISAPRAVTTFSVKPPNMLGLAPARSVTVAQPWQSEITESRVARLIRVHEEEAARQRVLEEEWSRCAWFSDVGGLKAGGPYRSGVKVRARTL